MFGSLETVLKKCLFVSENIPDNLRTSWNKMTLKDFNIFLFCPILNLKWSNRCKQAPRIIEILKKKKHDDDMEKEDNLSIENKNGTEN